VAEKPDLACSSIMSLREEQASGERHVLQITCALAEHPKLGGALMYRRSVIAVWLLSIAACGEAGSTLEMAIDIYLDAGSTQCEKDGASLEQMKDQLVAVGVAFANASCGVDGKVYTAMCGSPDGNIGIFKVSPDELPAVRALGFEALANIPDARRVSCSDR
jgi:hypothetical protein